MKDLEKRAHNTLVHGFNHLPPTDAIIDYEAIDGILQDVATRMHNNYPYHHPLYAGQMLKPPHPVARMAYSLAMEVNPNNHALDGGRESSQMEKDVVAHLAAVIGFEQHLGHLTGGGTLANMEALWVASKEKPGLAIAASANAHYTHNRLCGVLYIPFISIAVLPNGKMDTNDLRKKLETGTIGTVVVTLGTTGSGSLDPLDEILTLQEEYCFRLHIDAAYGGYFGLANSLPEQAKKQFQLIHQADSFVIDPHKHGLQPYGCGCILFKNPEVGRHYKHDSPYTYFTGTELHLGEISLECSRPGAAAVALYATQQLLPCKPEGEFAGMLDKCLNTAQWFYEKFKADERFKTVMQPELDIVLWSLKGESLADISARNKRFFDACEVEHLYLALYQIPAGQLPGNFAGILQNRNAVTVLRSCLMKPEHWDWKEKIWEIIDRVAETI